MNVFVSEYLCSGACTASLSDSSLFTEGAAMLDAVIRDLLSIPDCNVMTCVDEQFIAHAHKFRHWEEEQRLQVHYVSGTEQERQLFEQTCHQSDLVWIIAPEFDQILYSRTEQAIQSGAQVVGSDLTTIKVCADKWCLYELLKENSIPTIPTSLFEIRKSVSPQWFPGILKHRFGAGGLGLHYFTDIEEWYTRRSEVLEANFDFIWQPFISGTMLSAVVLLNAQRREIFPVGEQTISWQSGFEYRGGVIPADLENDVCNSIEVLLERACDALPGLRGYIGFDLLLSNTDPETPMIVEINPRLTTSYTGYRQLSEDNLAERIINPETEFPFIKWKKEKRVPFRSDGTVLLNQLWN